MNPFGRILGPAFGAVLGVTQPAHDPGPRRYTAPVEAPIPRDKPPIPGRETAATGANSAAAMAGAAAGAAAAANGNAAPAQGGSAGGNSGGAGADTAAAASAADQTQPEPTKEQGAVTAAQNAPLPAASGELSYAPSTGTAGAELLSPRMTMRTDRDLGAAVVPVPRPPPDRTLGAVIVPLPRPKPDKPPASASAAGRGTRLASVNPVERVPDDPACVGALTGAGVQFEILPSNENGSCGLTQPLKIASTGKEGVRFSPAAVMGCPQTRAVLAWLEKTVQPAATASLGGPITGIQVADSYSCRGRNNAPGAKLSEHAAGNAIDISGFQIGTGKQARWVKVEARKNPDDPEGKFLASVRQGACTYFTTVLGPGQPDHDDHFHLDIGKHGRSGTYRICQ